MPKKEEKCSCNCGQHIFVAIPASLAGIFLVLAVLFMFFARSDIILLVPIVWAFVVLGIVALFASLRAMKIRKE